MKYNVGDFVLYKHADDKIIENCIIIEIVYQTEFKLKTIEILDDLDTVSNDIVRYFDNYFLAGIDQIEPITNKKDLHRLRKMIVFK